MHACIVLLHILTLPFLDLSSYHHHCLILDDEKNDDDDYYPRII